MDKKKMQAMMKAMKNAKPDDDQMKMLSDLSDKYKDKSEEEIMKELKKIKNSMMKNTSKYKKQMKAIEELKGFLDDEQRKKLEKVMEHLKD
ncbi:MAG: hypothetical protein N4A57_01785 [Anaeromicrobium sp.]|jgi:mannitol/fructose-specific phosphotransferase system IIA component (Ntr-type)|uniref:hypothetical protein n=1 Tax=Anaeromicrobium sp. TaxID=1929132 RepID=UPI0025DB0318|nr:hypothetical protein [Anaeromicrobium sp.]MCT4592997.1 hypothetical protein [Anaeromicrobium sp.]